MNHIALFNGIGGFQLAAQWMGWNNIASCEIDEWCNRVTKYYWPNCIQHEDIRTTDFTVYRGKCDIVTGGFPCQPYSVAGKRKGKNDERHLWPEMLRAIREIQPAWVIGENVSGLINWNGGMVFDEVQANLETEGYEVIPFILPACGVNAPHRRDRIWFIAHSISTRSGNINQSVSDEGRKPGEDRGESIRQEYRKTCASWVNATSKIATDTDSDGQHGGNICNEKHTGERREYAQRDVEPGVNDGVITNPDGIDRRCGTGGKDGEKISNDNSNFTAHTENQRHECGTEDNRGDTEKFHTGEQRPHETDGSEPCGYSGITTDPCSTGRKQFHITGFAAKPGHYPRHVFEPPGNWENFPNQSPICDGNDGLSTRLVPITLPGKSGKRKISTSTRIRSYLRNHTIKAGGNAVVPLLPYKIMKAINEFNNAAK